MIKTLRYCDACGKEIDKPNKKSFEVKIDGMFPMILGSVVLCEDCEKKLCNETPARLVVTDKRALW